MSLCCGDRAVFPSAFFGYSALCRPPWGIYHPRIRPQASRELKLSCDLPAATVGWQTLFVNYSKLWSQLWLGFEAHGTRPIDEKQPVALHREPPRNNEVPDYCNIVVARPPGWGDSAFGRAFARPHLRTGVFISFGNNRSPASLCAYCFPGTRLERAEFDGGFGRNVNSRITSAGLAVTIGRYTRK